MASTEEPHADAPNTSTEDAHGHMDESGLPTSVGSRSPAHLTRLYEEAKEHHKRRELLSKAMDAECTFRPDTSLSKSKKVSVDNHEPVYERLYSKAKELERKKQDAAVLLDESCTFSPVLTARSSKKDDERSTGKAAHDSLYEKAKEHAEKLEKLREEYISTTCTFQPTITKKAKQLPRPGSAHTRLYDPEWVRSRKSMDRNDPEKRLVAEATFTPVIQRKPVHSVEAGAEATPEKESVFERLHSVSKVKAEELAAAKAKLEQDKLSECTFRPAVSRRPESSETNGASHEHGSPYERLYQNALEKAQRVSLQPSAAELGCTFQPSISSASKKLLESTRDPAEADIPRHVLLYEDGLQKQQARASVDVNRGRDITEDDIANCTFRPNVSPLPAKSIVTVPVYDRLYENARAKQATLAAAASGGTLDMATINPTRSVASAAPYHHATHAATVADAMPVAQSTKEMFLI